MIAIISQARVNSNRLPNKIFLRAGNHPFLYYHTERLKCSNLPVIIATTNNGSEKTIVDFCVNNKLPFYCGDEQNVLKRFYECALQFNVSTIIRVTSDCPLIDGKIIAKGLKNYLLMNDKNAYYSNALERSYPRGMDYEIFSFELLENAYLNARDSSDKEHVTPYIWKNKSGSVIVKNDIAEQDNSKFRVTLDTEEDRQLITRLIQDYNSFKLDCNGITEVLRNNPQLAQINAHVEQKKL